MTALAGVELESLVSEPEALTTRWLFIYPLQRGNSPPAVNSPQFKKCCYNRNGLFCD